MKDRRGSGGAGGDRFTVFPFSIGCMSQSSVAVAVADPNDKMKQPQSDPSSSSTTATVAAAATTPAQIQLISKGSSSEEGGAGGGEATKEKAGIVTARVLQRLVKGIKSLSQKFAVYDGEDDDADDEEHEMVIGYPTDVQHVGHIGWDGRGGLNKVGAMAMVNAFSLPSSLSMRQLEVAMDQAAHA